MGENDKKKPQVGSMPESVQGTERRAGWLERSERRVISWGVLQASGEEKVFPLSKMEAIKYGCQI